MATLEEDVLSCLRHFVVGKSPTISDVLTSTRFMSRKDVPKAIRCRKIMGDVVKEGTLATTTEVSGLWGFYKSKRSVLICLVVGTFILHDCEAV